MAIIPISEKFIGLSSSVDTAERRSTLINSNSQAYTMQDIIDTVSAGGGGGLEGTQYVFVAANGTDVENAAELQAAYVTAQGMSPGLNNRITVIAAAGNYNLGSTSFLMNTNYIDLVSLDGNRSIIFNSNNTNGTISVQTYDVFVNGVDVGTKNFIVGSAYYNIIIQNCKGVGDYSFGGGGTAGGTFTNCTGGDYSFGGGGIANGTFTNCTGGADSFGGGNGGTANGVFTNCIGGADSFGGQGGTASGMFTNCIGGSDSFGGNGGTANGTFTNCTGGNNSFGGQGTAIAVFKDCTGGNDSFGGNGGTASGMFTNCIGGNNSFGGLGILDGVLYSCRLTVGTFQTVSGFGRTVLCIDGNNNQNNQ
jgi:hypothetical protein